MGACSTQASSLLSVKQELSKTGQLQAFQVSFPVQPVLLQGGDLLAHVRQYRKDVTVVQLLDGGSLEEPILEGGVFSEAATRFKIVNSTSGPSLLESSANRCGGGGNLYETPDPPPVVVPSPTPTSAPRDPPPRPTRAPACPSDIYVCEGSWGLWPGWATRLVRTRCSCCPRCNGGWVALLAPAKVIYAKLENGGNIDQAVTQMAEVASQESKDTLMYVDEKLVEPLQSKLALLDPERHTMINPDVSKDVLAEVVC